MVVEDILAQKKTAIVKRWFQLILETYPADASRFLEQERDSFLNPVGCIISPEIETIYDELLHGMNPNKLATSLDKIVRIRSVQDFSPSQAIAFVFLLKKAVREKIAGKLLENYTLERLLEFESRIDKLALLALDIYMECREKVYEIRVNEIKAEREMAFRLLARTNATYEKPETE